MIWGCFIFISFCLQLSFSSILGEIDKLEPIQISEEKCYPKIPDDIAEEMNMTTPQIIQKYNYTVETHNIVTEDGYILTLHRIPNGRKKISTKGSVLIMHGILASSTDWIITRPGNGLGYILADEGYDVWLGNARGNRYCRNHTTYRINSRKFWDFSFHEIGLYDLPAMIDHIIQTTGEEKIFYIAHSQGSAAFYVMASMRPTYNDKIRAHFGLAPVAYINHIKSLALTFLNFNSFILKNFARLFGINELLPKDGLVSELGQKFCGLGGIHGMVCENFLFLICGYDSKQLNTTLLPLILAHVPAGASVKQLLHFSQEMRSGKFREFDYGIFGNFRRYGSCSPPNYDLSRITAPVYLFHSKNDLISTPTDVKRLAKQLKNLQGDFIVGDNRFNHLDFLFGLDAPKILYSHLISLMKRHDRFTKKPLY